VTFNLEAKEEAEKPHFIIQLLDYKVAGIP
jgi:hypothetical protein